MTAKVYRWLDSAPIHIRHPTKPWLRQLACVMAAPSKAAVARAAGEKDPRNLFNLDETGNAEDIAMTMAEPGVIFWSWLDEREYHKRNW